MMLKIPQTLMRPLRQALLKCDEFDDPKQLKAIFVSEVLRLWKDGLNIVNNKIGQIDIIIAYLADKWRSSGENGLILFLKVLADRYANPDDERYDLLRTITQELEWINQRPPQPKISELEANPEKAQMIWTAEIENILSCARSVGRIQVPLYVNGQKQGDGNSGTAWLIAPGLAVTCWHVIENRIGSNVPLEQTDLERQLENALLTFDYTVAGKGVQYRVTKLECPSFERHPLDYAILRIQDRQDCPLQDRGYLRVDREVPITTQTALYIIQHPLGQAQQSAGGSFVKDVPPDRILYTTPH